MTDTTPRDTGGDEFCWGCLKPGCEACWGERDIDAEDEKPYYDPEGWPA